VNRAIPYKDFEGFVTAYVTRVSKWERSIIADIKLDIKKKVKNQRACVNPLY
jgi:hypothetical protein